MTTQHSLTPMQLFCFPFAGASYYAYAPLIKEIEGKLDVIALDLPGHGKRIQESLLTDVRTMAQDLLPMVKSSIKGPYGFFGHSLGALVAFELTRLIHDTGISPPIHLFISGRKGPLTPSPEISVKGLSRQELLKKVADYGGTPSLLLEQEEFMDFMAPILRADFEAVASYRYKPGELIDQPMTVLAGTREGISSEQAAQWQQVTRCKTKIQWFEGEHFFIFNHLPDIARLITRQMAPSPPIFQPSDPAPTDSVAVHD